MRYFISVIDDKSNSATENEMANIDVFNDHLVSEGHWVFAAGLADPHTSKVVDNRQGAGLIMDGPLVESKEYLSGFWIISASDFDAALKLAADGSKACNRRVEVRPLFMGG